MAQEKARPTRARTKKDGATAPKARKPRARPSTGSGDVQAIATLAYLMWERGEPGDATDHWLRAEKELAA